MFSRLNFSLLDVDTGFSASFVGMLHVQMADGQTRGMCEGFQPLNRDAGGPSGARTFFKSN